MELEWTLFFCFQEVFTMEEKIYLEDKPRDCKYCYWWYKRKGYTYHQGCYYELTPEPQAKKSPCDGCAYGKNTPCIGYFIKEVMKAVLGRDAQG